MNPWKSVLYAVLSAVIPLLYSLATGKFPDFPLDLQSFMATLLWLAALLVGGWNVTRAYAEPAALLKSVLYAVLVTLLPMVYNLLIAKYPLFPLDQGSFSALLLWLIGLPLGGWQAFKAVAAYQIRKHGEFRVSRGFVIRGTGRY